MEIKYTDSDGKTLSTAGLVAKVVGAAVLGLFTLFTAMAATEVVPTGHIGLKVRFGKVVSDGLEADRYWYNPFTTDMVTLDAQIQKWEASTETYTRDVQQARIAFTLNYRMDPTFAKAIYIDTKGLWAEKLIGQVVVEAIKNELGKHNAVDFIAKRNEAARNIEATITASLLKRHVLATGFQLRDVAFTEAFEQSVEEKVKAEQEAIREKNNTVKVTELANQAIETAKGKAESTVLAAKAQAEATLVLAKAEAESIRIRGEALSKNQNLVELVTAERWNGALPTQMYGSAPVPFINVPGGK